MSEEKFVGEKAKYLAPRPDKNVALDQANPQKLEAYINAPDAYKFAKSGIAGNPSIEPVPLYNRLTTDRVFNNDRNSWLILGTDRPGAPTEGYGGKGHTQCGAIDLVVGRMSSYVRERDDTGAIIKVNPDFKVDSARIYISQKSDIDEYFGLPDGKVGNPPACSAVAIKADEVRVISRGGIKLITGQDARDSRGQRVLEISGIDLIAGPGQDPDLQPLVKGNNLRDALEELGNQVEALREIVYSFLKYQREMNQKIISHTHNSPFYGLTTGPSSNMMSKAIQTVVLQTAQTELSIVSHMTNMSLWEVNYLKPGFDSYINSDYNTTT
jgi:hypothetical protein